jgi:FdhE protein
MNASPWKRRIERSTDLLESFPEAGELLKFYCRVAKFQESIFDSLWRTGQTDLNAVAHRLPDLYAVIEADDVATLDGAASNLLATGLEGWQAMLRTYWDNSGYVATYDSAQEFFSRALLQPYAEYLSSRGNAPMEGEGTCPFCTARPVVGILRPEGDGGKRSLMCSMCATEWVFRRVICPNCGETDKDKLPVYKAESVGHVRLEACDSCHRYLKSVDLTVNGLAVPVVDELATATLDVWAEEAGYVKIQPNLLGL